MVRFSSSVWPVLIIVTFLLGTPPTFGQQEVPTGESASRAARYLAEETFKTAATVAKIVNESANQATLALSFKDKVNEVVKRFKAGVPLSQVAQEPQTEEDRIIRQSLATLLQGLTKCGTNWYMIEAPIPENPYYDTIAWQGFSDSNGEMDLIQLAKELQGQVHEKGAPTATKEFVPGPTYEKVHRLAEEDLRGKTILIQALDFDVKANRSSLSEEDLLNGERPAYYFNLNLVTSRSRTNNGSWSRWKSGPRQSTQITVSYRENGSYQYLPVGFATSKPSCPINGNEAFAMQERYFQAVGKDTQAAYERFLNGWVKELITETETKFTFYNDSIFTYDPDREFPGWTPPLLEYRNIKVRFSPNQENRDGVVKLHGGEYRIFRHKGISKSEGEPGYITVPKEEGLIAYSYLPKGSLHVGTTTNGNWSIKGRTWDTYMPLFHKDAKKPGLDTIRSYIQMLNDEVASPSVDKAKPTASLKEEKDPNPYGFYAIANKELRKVYLDHNGSLFLMLHKKTDAPLSTPRGTLYEMRGVEPFIAETLTVGDDERRNGIRRRIKVRFKVTSHRLLAQKTSLFTQNIETGCRLVREKKSVTLIQKNDGTWERVVTGNADDLGPFSDSSKPTMDEVRTTLSK